MEEEVGPSSWWKKCKDKVFLANYLPQTADPLKNMVAVGQTFDTANSAGHMSHLVVHSVLPAWENINELGHHWVVLVGTQDNLG